MSVEKDPSILEVTQADPGFIAVGDWWIDSLTAAVEAVEVSIDGETWRTSPVAPISPMYTHPGGCHIRPVNNVTVYARRARLS